jgi:aspartyl-tRNA(Asn)/glutamyl-tRNA(Gln) amidotransferase subunit A
VSGPGAWTCAEARARLRGGELSPAELGGALRGRIAARNDQLHAYTWVAPPGGEAPRGDPRTPGAPPLLGLPGAIKENLASRGEPTACGSRILAGWRPPYDATAVRRLREAGAVILGKTRMDEFGMGSSTEHAAGGPARNPWDPSRTPGGSSGGAAAAVAAGLALWALGTDTGGSVRQPAHCCGVVGLKPTYGRVSRHGLVAFASSLDQIGVLCRDVTGAAEVYAAIAGRDPLDATSLDAPVGDPVGACARPVGGMTVGVPRALLAEGLDDDVAADLDATLAGLAAAGVRVVDVELPAAPHAVAAYQVLAAAEASANLARYDGGRYGLREEGATWAAQVAATRTAGFGPEVKRRILLGTFVLSAGYRDAYYRRAQQARALIARDFAAAFAACDAVALTTAPTAAFPLGSRLDDPVQMYLADVFTVPASLAGLPAVSVPTGLDRDGLPLSLQLVGPALREEGLLRLAAAVERVRGFPGRKEAPWSR